MLKTQNYGFNKPELSDSPPDITVMNPNWDTIDKKIKENTDAIAQNSQEIGQKLDKGSSFYADLEAYYGNTKLIDDFQDISKYTKYVGDFTYNTTNVKLGGTTVKLLSNTKGMSAVRSNNINLDLTKLYNGELSNDDDYIYFVFYVEDITKMDNTSNIITLRFSQDNIYSDTNAKIFQGTKGFNISDIVQGWNFLKLRKSEAYTAGSGSWSSIKSYFFGFVTNTTVATSVSFQLIQLVKADPLEDEPNSFQKFGIKELNIHIGEWFLGKEFGNLVCKELSGQNLSSRSLEVLSKFKDFDGNINVIPKSTSYTLGGIWVDSSNYIAITGTNTSLIISKRFDGVNTSETFNINLTNSLVRLDIKRKGTDILIKINDLVYETTFEYLGECNLIVGSSNPGNNYLENVSITEISHAHHSDISEVAKTSNQVKTSQVPVVKTTPQTVKDKKSKQMIFPYHWVYPAGSETSVGILKLRLPITWNGTMFNMSLSGFDYVDGISGFELLLSAYTNIGASIWERTTASIKGKAPFTKVRFAHDGERCCILLGETNTVWKHPSLSVDLLRIYYLGVDEWEDGWSAEIITSEAGLKGIVEPELLGSTPKQTIITSGFASGWSGQLSYRKNQENKVTIFALLTKSTDIIDAETLYTLPASLRPRITHTATCLISNSAGEPLVYGTLWVDSQGVVKIKFLKGQVLTNTRIIYCIALDYYIL